jgi:hypothetical protein
MQLLPDLVYALELLAKHDVSEMLLVGAKKTERPEALSIPCIVFRLESEQNKADTAGMT